MPENRSICFNANERRDFYQRVRETAIDERRAVDLAEVMAREWIKKVISHDRLDLSACVVHKSAGYSADLHQYCRRALRAAAAADRWFNDHDLEPPDHLVFELPDLWLGEYFLLRRHAARRGVVSTTRPWPELLGFLLQACPARSSTPRFESREIEIPASARQTRGHIPTTDAIFIASMDNYLIPMIPVMAEMLERGLRPSVVVPAGADGWSHARRIPRGVIRWHFEDILTQEAIVAMTRARELTTDAWEHAARDLVPLLCVEGIDLSPLVLPDLHRMAVDAVPDAIAWADAAEALVRASGARAVVCARHRKVTETAFSLGARRAGAAVMMLLHGHISQAAERRFEDGSFELSDAVCVWGTHQRTSVIEKGTVHHHGRVVVTGNPAWDDLRAMPRSEPRVRAARGRVAEALNLHPDGAWIVLTTQEDSRAQFEDAARAILSDPRATLIVKTHPREPAHAYDHASSLPGGDRVRLVCSDTPALHDLLLAADALVTFHSTTNVESLLLGTPVITAAFGRLLAVDRLVPLERFGLPLATNPESLHAIVTRLSDDPAGFRADLGPAIAAAVLAVAGDNQRPAASRVCEVLLGLWNTPPTGRNQPVPAV